MTKKDYEMIAEVIKQCSYLEHRTDAEGDYLSTEINFMNLVSNLGVRFKEDNPNFNEFKFADACEPKDFTTVYKYLKVGS